ncbi:hypothetical protein EDB81DRAFT_401433 [Dactylonectria macrodidyma]|uniref:Uncharacterized protein n=1 Tax=Dactylonectria macrodidyma TaxID=307937 RepID=A0A9P9JE55_9HYPO|nr:hypothetical protein EDB81DRAFT_401433 [Dactylonectria macrodidyma]
MHVELLRASAAHVMADLPRQGVSRSPNKPNGTMECLRDGSRVSLSHLTCTTQAKTCICHYICIIAFPVLLDPIQACLVQSFTSIIAKEAEAELRTGSIKQCLTLIAFLNGIFNWASSCDPKSYLDCSTFSTTRRVPCSTILHDKHHALPKRDQVFKAIDGARVMM